MRCPDCNKFVSYGEQDPELEDISVEGDEDGGTVTGSVRVVLPCGECSTELKETTLEFEETFDHKCPGGEEDCPVCDGEGEIECVDCEGTGEKEDEEGNTVECDTCGGTAKESCEDCEGTGVTRLAPTDYSGDFYDIDESDVTVEFSSRTQTEYKDKSGKMRPAPSRKWRTYYGAMLTIPVKCNLCDEEIVVYSSVEEQASGFEELV